MVVTLIIIGICAIIAGVHIFFIVSLLKYIKLRNRNKNSPDTYDSENMRVSKIKLIVSSVLFALLWGIIITFCILLTIAMRNM